MKIAILGTRGIPNFHGGFEQFAQILSPFLVGEGHDVTVYNSHKHPFTKSNWKGVKIVHKFDPEYKIGAAGQFIYDLNCILDIRKKNFDVILVWFYSDFASKMLQLGAQNPLKIESESIKNRLKI